MSSLGTVARFGAFEVDLCSGELLKDGLKVKFTRAANPSSYSTAGTPERDRDARGTASATLAFGDFCRFRTQPELGG